MDPDQIYWRGQAVQACSILFNQLEPWLTEVPYATRPRPTSSSSSSSEERYVESLAYVIPDEDVSEYLGISRSFRKLIQYMQGVDMMGRLPTPEEWEAVARSVVREPPHPHERTWQTFYEHIMTGITNLTESWDAILPRANANRARLLQLYQGEARYKVHRIVKQNDQEAFDKPHNQWERERTPVLKAVRPTPDSPYIPLDLPTPTHNGPRENRRSVENPAWETWKNRIPGRVARAEAVETEQRNEEIIRGRRRERSRRGSVLEIQELQQMREVLEAKLGISPSSQNREIGHQSPQDAGHPVNKHPLEEPRQMAVATEPLAIPRSPAPGAWNMLAPPSPRKSPQRRGISPEEAGRQTLIERALHHPQRPLRPRSASRDTPRSRSKLSVESILWEEEEEEEDDDDDEAGEELDTSEDEDDSFIPPPLSRTDQTTPLTFPQPTPNQSPSPGTDRDKPLPTLPEKGVWVPPVVRFNVKTPRTTGNTENGGALPLGMPLPETRRPLLDEQFGSWRTPPMTWSDDPQSKMALPEVTPEEAREDDKGIPLTPPNTPGINLRSRPKESPSVIVEELTGEPLQKVTPNPPRATATQSLYPVMEPPRPSPPKQRRSPPVESTLLSPRVPDTIQPPRPGPRQSRISLETPDPSNSDPHGRRGYESHTSQRSALNHRDVHPTRPSNPSPPQTSSPPHPRPAERARSRLTPPPSPVERTSSRRPSRTWEEETARDAAAKKSRKREKLEQRAAREEEIDRWEKKINKYRASLLGATTCHCCCHCRCSGHDTWMKYADSQTLKFRESRKPRDDRKTKIGVATQETPFGRRFYEVHDPIPFIGRRNIRVVPPRMSSASSETSSSNHSYGSNGL